MNRNLLSYGLTTILLATSISFNAHAGKDDTGAIVGAIVGGLLGSNVGKGNGKIVATGLGIVIGAVIGNDIGEQLDENDRRALEEAQRNSFQRPVGQRTDWDGNRYGSRTGSYGNFRTTREGYSRYNSREICREYESVIVTRQKTETRTGVACTKANGTWTEVKSTDVVFRNGDEIRTETITHGRDNNYDNRNHRRPPGPGHVVPTPTYGGNYASLKGYCQDYDHQEFYVAKNFAYSASGINLNSTDATQWALEYVQSHRCGTINEYSSRFRALYNMAYSPSGLNMNSSDARNYALQKVEYTTEARVRQMQETAAKVKNFVYSANGLNRDSATAGRAAMEWIDRRSCEDADHVQTMWNQYTKEYNFAYSSSGLNKNSSDARAYALNKISHMSRCSDLLR